MKDPYEHIHWATNARLAEMVGFVDDHFSQNMTHEENETLREAVRRLEAFDNRPIKFNHEQFE